MFTIIFSKSGFQLKFSKLVSKYTFQNVYSIVISQMFAIRIFVNRFQLLFQKCLHLYLIVSQIALYFQL